jgi:hypothetical protein
MATVPTELVRYATSDTNPLGNWTFNGPVTLELLQQLMTGRRQDAANACASGSADAAGNCN